MEKKIERMLGVVTNAWVDAPNKNKEQRQKADILGGMMLILHGLQTEDENLEKRLAARIKQLVD